MGFVVDVERARVSVHQEGVPDVLHILVNIPCRINNTVSWPTNNSLPQLFDQLADVVSQAVRSSLLEKAATGLLLIESTAPEGTSKET